MITANDVMPLLLAACPSFAPAWEQEVREYNLDAAVEAGRLCYLDAVEFIAHLVNLARDGRTAEFPGVFEVLERLVVDGDEYVSELGVIGYLEGLQNRNVTGPDLDPDVVFRPLLHPECERYWRELEKFWVQVADFRATDRSRRPGRRGPTRR